MKSKELYDEKPKKESFVESLKESIASDAALRQERHRTEYRSKTQRLDSDSSESDQEEL